jgi:ankyrin repeat protein
MLCNGDCESVLKLLPEQHGIDFNWRNSLGDTALRIALEENGAFTQNGVKMLLANGCEFNAINWVNRETALFYIVDGGSVQILLEATKAMFRKAFATRNAAEAITAEVLTVDGQILRKLPITLVGVNYHPEVIEAVLKLIDIDTERVEREVEVKITVGGPKRRKNEPFVVRTNDGVEIQPRKFKKAHDGVCWATRDVLHTTGKSAGVTHDDVQRRLATLLANDDGIDRAVQAAMASFINLRRISDGKTALHCIISVAILKDDENLLERTRTLEILLQNGARLDLADQRGKTILHYAAALTDTGIMKMILDAYVRNFRQQKKWPEGNLTLKQAVELATAVTAEMNKSDAMAGDNSVYFGMKMVQGRYLAAWAKEKSGQTPLHDAVLSLNPDMVEFIVDIPESIFRGGLGRGKDDALSLPEAYAFARIPKIDTTKRDLRGCTPLMLAELNETGPEFDRLVNANNWKKAVEKLRALTSSEDKKYAVLYNLELAIMSGDRETSAAILADNPYIDMGAKNADGLTPLELAVKQRYDGIVEDLLNYMTALDRISTYAPAIMKVLDEEEKHGKEKGRHTEILQLFRKDLLRLLVSTNDIEALQLALRENADMNAENANGLLRQAILLRRVEISRELLDYMMNPARIIDCARTVRISKMLADRLPRGVSDRDAIQRLLTGAETKVNAALRDALLRETEDVNIKAVKQILAAGVDMTEGNPGSSVSALSDAVDKGTSNIAWEILQYMITPGRIDTCEGTVRAVKARVDGWTTGDRQGFRTFQNKFKDVETMITDAKKDDMAAIVPRDLPPSAPNFDANVALFRAVIAGEIEDTRNALASDAFVNERNGYGHTALYLATAKGHVDIVAMLLKAGANPERNGDDTELWAAVVNLRDTTITEILLDHMTTPRHISIYAPAIMKVLNEEEGHGEGKGKHMEILQLLRAARRRTSTVYPIFGDEEPLALEEFVLNAGQHYPIAVPGDATIDPQILAIAGAYRNIPPTIQNWLQRLGVVVLDGNAIRCPRALHLIRVAHRPITGTTANWRWTGGNLRGIFAVRIFSPRTQPTSFVEPFDVPVPTAGGLRTASLPNGFFKKSFPWTPGNASQFQLQFRHPDPTAPLKFHALVLTLNEVYMTTETVPGQ